MAMTSSATTKKPNIRPILVADLLRYLRATNWSEIPHPNSRLFLFESGTDDQGQPIQLVLPSQDIYEDAPHLITKAIKLLSILQSRSIQETQAIILQEQVSPLPSQ
jgi:hypothetical protein